MWLEKKYVSLLSNTLTKFKQKSDNLWNFRCPICDDSQANKNKARGYIYQKQGKYIYHCHNCNITLSFQKFLNQLNPILYDSYVQERYSILESENIIPEQKKIIVPSAHKHLQHLKKISQLSPTHYCKKYIVNRQIPSDYHYKLFYCPKFKEWTNTILPNKFESLNNDKSRLIIPLFTSDGQLIGYQGRALDPTDKQRYITIMLDETKPRLYGLDTVDINKRYYIFEGPIDSMFIENSIATCGGTLIREMNLLNKNTDNAVIVYDNEPRNQDICKNMLNALKHNYKVCIWPSSINQKDINEMILKKVSGQYCKTEVIKKAGLYIKNIIDENTYSGLEGELMLNTWRKI